MAEPPAATLERSFDAHNPPPQELIDACVHCGFCLQVCPTYQLWGEEMDSPRGRIYLMKMIGDRQIPLHDTAVRNFDQCLGCMACMTACPSGVKYDRLIEATRAQIERQHPRTRKERRFRDLIFRLFPYPERLRLLVLPGWIYQKSGLRWLAHNSGLLKLLPVSARAMEGLMPEVPLASLWSDMPAVVKAQGTKRRRVGLLLGCVQRVFFPGVNQATARVLSAEGCDVIVPAEQSCCGALMVHAGREEEALNFARKLIDVFERAQVDTIVVNAAGCGSSMKDYGYMLRSDPAYKDKARAFSAKCRDVSEVLSELEPRAPRNPLPLRVAYHDSCHLQHAQGVRNQPRSVLASIPQLQVLEVPEAALCCGSAGIYNLVEPGPAKELGDRKTANVISTHPDVLVSANPGCLLQIQSGLQRAGKNIPVRHLVEVVDASIRGAALL